MGEFKRATGDFKRSLDMDNDFKEVKTAYDDITTPGEAGAESGLSPEAVPEAEAADEAPPVEPAGRDQTGEAALQGDDDHREPKAETGGS